ncbi:MAG: glycosyltransferase family 2 protein [Campylobacterales bacterium]|nr:glycosyltransferase family 2 protein [Campylobacterales bacterium]
MGQDVIKNKPLVSVITVVFNGKNYLEQTIQSVLSQTYDNIEYIVIDGGSTDGTIEIVRKYKDKISYLISEPDNGIFDAMNKGASIATREYIYYLNAGDAFYSDNTLFDVVNHLNDNKVNTHTLLVGNVLLTHNGKDLRFAPVVGTNLPHQGAFVKTEMVKKYKFDSKLKIYGDSDLWYRMNMGGEFVPVYIPNTICKFPLDGVGSSPKFIWNRYLESKYLCNQRGQRLAIVRKFLLTLFGYTVYKIGGEFAYRHVYEATINFFIKIKRCS